MGIIAGGIDAVKDAVDHYLKDLGAMSEAEIMDSPGGSARRPIDFSFEVGFVNLRIAARIKKEVPPVDPSGDGWSVVPLELATKTAISEYISSTADVLIKAASEIPDDEALTTLVGPVGKERPVHEMLHFAAMHIMYHDAQLNFIQSLNGDLAVHWS